MPPIQKGAVLIGFLAALLLVAISFRPMLVHPGSAATPLEILGVAVDNNDTATIDAALRNGFDINAPIAVGEPMLLTAAAGDRYKAAHFLLDHGANPNCADAYRWTPLHYAAKFGHPAVLELLLQHGANINAKTTSGDTPLIVAARYPFPECVRCLIAAGADPSITNARGETALSAALLEHRPENADIVSSKLPR